MKKAFKSSTIQDQQVVSKNSIPNPVADIYNQSDKPPPLNILSPYRYANIQCFHSSAFYIENNYSQRENLCWLLRYVFEDFHVHENKNCCYHTESHRLYLTKKSSYFSIAVLHGIMGSESKCHSSLKKIKEN